MKHYSFDELCEGLQESLTITINAADIGQFAKLSGDCSPIHVDASYARERGFPGCVCHGALLGAYVSRLIGTQLPGSGGLLQKLELQFRQPCFAGDEICIAGVVTRKIDAVRTILINLTITNTKTGEVIANGKAQSGIAVSQRMAA